VESADVEPPSQRVEGATGDKLTLSTTEKKSFVVQIVEESTRRD